MPERIYAVGFMPSFGDPPCALWSWGLRSIMLKRSSRPLGKREEFGNQHVSFLRARKIHETYRFGLHVGAVHRFRLDDCLCLVIFWAHAYGSDRL